MARISEVLQRDVEKYPITTTAASILTPTGGGLVGLAKGVRGALTRPATQVAEAVARLPKDAVIGRTCLNSIELAEKAIAEGATYVAFGAIYATETKPEAGNIGLQTLKEAKAKLNVPICAIGGLTVENSSEVIDAGADLCAVISDILGLSMSAIPDRIEQWADLFASKA
jgi:thiamine-phosphate pyrophosphorylase